MIGFWILFSFLSLFWLTAVVNQGGAMESVILLSALFYLFYFLLPIMNKRLKILTYVALPLVAMATFWSTSAFPAVWLILTIIGMEGTSHMSFVMAAGYHLYVTAIALIPTILSEQGIFPFAQLMVFIFLSVLSLYLRSFSIRTGELKKERDQIYSEHRHLKRQVVRGEQLARQEERSVVARDIHDSVGHRLTALVMQLEVARYQTGNEKEKEQLTTFKKLAQQSLHETRSAVSALKADETAGLQAVIQLVRKLEAESHIQIRFLLESGVLNEPLSNKQSIVLYRAIQESLTNMMRHSHTREADIQFKLIADRYFQFSVSHPLKEKVELKEGFGLSNMRKRLEELDGNLTISQHGQRFRLTGQFPLDIVNRIEDQK
ncbi:MAG: sensor histidine kinase [Alkalibacterium sp.]|nr:sensor histidine kinase [Alkalibacterium sp.]